MVTAAGVAVNHEGGNKNGASCRLLVGGTIVDGFEELFLAEFPDPGAKQAFSLTGGATVTAGAKAELQCEATFANGQVASPSMTATQVGELKAE